MTLDDIIEKRNTARIPRIVSHVLFWMVLYTSSCFLIKASLGPYTETPLSYLTPLRNTIGLALVFYPLMYVFVPRFLKQKRWLAFILSLAGLTLLYIFIEALGEKLVFHFCDSCRTMAAEKNPDYLSVIQKSLGDNILFKASNFGLFFNLFSSLILPIAIKSSVGYYQVHNRNLQLEKEKVQLELNFLKAQVNPHFLFNTLNNLYGLIIHKRVDESAETVTRLSDFMRYSLDNAHKKEISLSEEITLIQNYIELEKLRLNHTQVSFTTDIDNEHKSLPPLLFIPLIENAFKYSVDKKDTDIHIDLKVQDNELRFTIRNTFDPHKRNHDMGGLGLSNLQKRLDVYFSDTYVYDVTMEDSVYTAYLKLVLA
ncbi:histidine kinase [Dokdonia sp.]|uniref:sensor histidine kinase n=1 Tax=Dokdonia sp. TaxID=2024995 RepID=UPI00326759E0